MADNKWEGWDKSEMSPVWDFKTDKSIKGILVSKEEKVGPNESMMYTIRLDNGETRGVWGNTLLDSRLKNLVTGDEVGIEYLGKVMSPKTQREYHNFEVYHKKGKLVNAKGEEAGF